MNLLGFFKNKVMHSKFKLFYIISFLEYIISGIYVILTSLDSGNAEILDLPKKIFLLAVILFCLAFLILLFGIITEKKNQSIDIFFQRIPKKFIFWLKTFSIFIILWGVISVFFPIQWFGNIKGYFWLLKPVSIPTGFVFLQFWLFLWLERHEFKVSQDLHKYLYLMVRSFFILLTILLTICISLYFSKIGLVYKTGYWNVPGIPITGIQFLSIIVFTVFSQILLSNNSINVTAVWRKRINVIIPVLIYLITITVWSYTPMVKHFFSLEPTAPNFQPFPVSDARDYDLGALSILKGYGINFSIYTDKPLYMVFLAVLHLISGNNYSLLIFLQVLVLGIIPCFLYIFGKKYFNTVFGFTLALTLILQQRNSILLSHQIASVNPKLLVTEIMTLLGIILIAYLLFLWCTTRQTRYGFILGAAIGSTSLVRFTPILIVVIAGVYCFFIFKKTPKLLIKQILLLGLGFLVVFTPYALSSINSVGQLQIINKIYYVFHVRYDEKSNSQTTITPDLQSESNIQDLNLVTQNPIQVIESDPEIATLPENQITNTSQSKFMIFVDGINLKISSIVQKIEESSVITIINHFFHNFSTSLLALPDSTIFTSLNELRQREYWQESNNWNGILPINQSLMIIGNLIFVSLGLAYSWTRYRWIGFGPLFIFLTYNFVLSFSMTSGSRYIVPINWIIYFYFLLGWVFIINLINLRFNPKIESLLLPNNSNITANKNQQSGKFIPVLISIIVISLMIPISNLLVPRIINNKNILSQISPAIVENQDKINWAFGEILYPYYWNNSTLFFNFLSGSTVSSYTIDMKNFVDKDTVLESQQPALLGTSMVDEKQVLEYIILVNDNDQTIIWKKSP